MQGCGRDKVLFPPFKEAPLSAYVSFFLALMISKILKAGWLRPVNLFQSTTAGSDDKLEM